MVHYTSASNALRIIRSRRITLRNASLMNDFSEINHGERCLISGWNSVHGLGLTPHEGRLFQLLGRVSPTIFPAIEQGYNRHLNIRKADTFILSLAEHNDQAEGSIGKLSMWRAYGGRTNVAIVVHPGFLFSESETSVYSAPVIYSSAQEFPDLYFSRLVDSIERNFEKVSSLDRDYIVQCVLSSFNTMALATKHPGFFEEKEWRLIYAPWQDKSDSINYEIIDIGGIPQKVFHVELEDRNTEKPSTGLNNLLKKIIVGPTENPWVLYEAFVEELERAGVEDAPNKVVVSDIPMRR
jgi:hypothetical protein